MNTWNYIIISIHLKSYKCVQIIRIEYQSFELYSYIKKKKTLKKG